MPDQSTSTSWHTQTTEQVCAQLAVTPAQGLMQANAAQRLVQFGENKLKGKH